MKIGGPPALDPGRRLDQAYGVKTAPPTSEAPATLPGPGTLLKGRVLNIAPTGLLTVDTELGAFKATAASVLAVGQEFWFEVVQTGANPLLAEAGKKNAILNLLRIMLPGLLAVDSPLPGTAADLPTGEVSNPTQETAPLHRFLIDNAVDGTPDPGKLLKTISRLNLSPPTGTEAEGPSRPAAPPLSLLHEVESPALQKLIRLLEAHTMVTQQPAAGSDYLLFPVFFADQAGRGEWLFSYEQEGGGAADPTATTNISFYLAMSRLGDTHLTITSRQNTLTGVLTLTSDDATEHVRRQLPQLVQALKPLADEVVISCRTAPLDCLKTLKDDLTAKAGLERFALVDLKA